MYVTVETIPDVTDDFDLGVSVGEPTWDWAVDSDVGGSWNQTFFLNFSKSSCSCTSKMI